MKYLLYCLQRGSYFADNTQFDSLDEIREQLIDYHSYDCDEDSLNEQSLADLVSGFEWEIHTEQGEVVTV